MTKKVLAMYLLLTIGCVDILNASNCTGLSKIGYHAQIKTKTITVDGIKVDYTLVYPPGHRPDQAFEGDVLHYYHSAFGSSEKVYGSSAMIKLYEKFLNKKNLPNPLVLSISLGKFWMLETPRSAPLKGKVSAEFIIKVLKKIENLEEISATEHKAIGGSMGAFNLFQIILKDSTLYRKLALIALPTIEELPLSSEFTKKYLERIRKNIQFNTGKEKLSLKEKLLTRVFRSLVNHLYRSDQDEFSKINPLHQITKSNELLLPPIILSTGEKDELGYFPANEQLALDAKEKNLPIVWKGVSDTGHQGPYPLDEIFDFLYSEF